MPRTSERSTTRNFECAHHSETSCGQQTSNSNQLLLEGSIHSVPSVDLEPPSKAFLAKALGQEHGDAAMKVVSTRVRVCYFRLLVRPLRTYTIILMNHLMANRTLQSRSQNHRWPQPTTGGPQQLRTAEQKDPCFEGLLEFASVLGTR